MAKPKVFGHRGAPDVLPENTLEGFEYTLGTDADGIELDVLITRDGIPVVTHNPRLMAATTRAPDGAWLIEEGPAIGALDYADLKQFNVGGIRENTSYRNRHPDQALIPNAHVPKLSEVLQLIRNSGRDIEVLVELKHSPVADAVDHQAAAEDFVTLTRDAISSAGLVDNCFLHSFSWPVLANAATSAPELRRSGLSLSRTLSPQGTVFPQSPWLDGCSDGIEEMLQYLSDARYSVWSPHFADLRPESLALAKKAGLQVMTWTHRGQSSIRHGLASGVDGIIVDDPAIACALRDEASIS